MTIDELLEKYRESAENESAKGKMFERLMKNFLPYHYAGYIEKVMLWSEFSGEHDLGIDLVAETFNGELWAIQCKFYAETTTIEKSAVDSFISNSGRNFGGRNFSLRIFISTSSKFNANAKKALKNQTPPVIQIGLEDLRQAAVDWEKIAENKPARISRELRDYQQEALTNAQKYFQMHERGKLIMACGTGKTFTALKIAETLTENRGLVLFLVPSLSLMGQTLHEWRNFSEKPIRAVCVCSDKTVARKNNDDDILETNLPLPVTTDPQEISAAIQRRGNFGLTVIFSTYQSLEKVIDAKLNFDLTICDEAHRTAGNSQQDKETKLFSLVHDNTKIISRRRIYMTATPKLYSENLKSAAAEKNLTVWSMDDKQIFGEEFFKISFAKAVHDGWLSNYQILIFAVSEGEIQQAMRTEILEKVQAFVDDWQAKHGKPGKKIDVSFNVDEIAKLVGTINALSKRVTDDSKILLEGDLQPMNKAVAFLPKIVDSEITAHIFSMIEELYKATLKNSEAEKLIDITAEHIDGSTNAAARDEKLSNLKNTPENLCRIISNVRCLSEGVDVPSLDAVIFLTPKKSKVDIIQAVGRALRKAANKKFGYVIIPIIAPAVINGETKKYFEANNEKYATIYEVVRMLGANDETLNVEVERLQVSGKSKKIKVLRTPEFNAEQMNLPFEIFQTELIAQVVSHAGNKNYWLEWAQKVSVIVQRHTENIKKLIAVKNSPQAAAFENFLNDLHQIINPAVTETDAVDMLAQHLVTRPVFEALFENYSFAENNPVSKSMQKILLQLDKTGLQNDRAELQEFYDNVKEQCRDMGNAENRQKIIVNLYDSFFKMALPLTAQKLGIVYTPVEVVDFILNSVNDVLKKHFACNISSKNVHVLDPFTGTGTFLTRLIQSGLINHADLLRKYQNELHANEIVLLAYYIAAINIENAFHDAVGLKDFFPFDGICLTDTFQTYENAKEIYLAGMENPLRENSAMIKAQLDQKITVIVGNPPYSVGQRSANDNAQNVAYPKISARIAQTYAAGTNATNKNSLYDSYIKAFRWASDRIGNSGIIGFITNSGWIDKDAFAGLRKSFANEFSYIYVFNLKGDIRGKMGENARRAGQNIFNIMTGVAVNILVKSEENQRENAKIFYYEVEDYLNREEKLAKIKSLHSVLADEFKILTPNEKGDWINQRGNLFENFLPLAPEKKFDGAAESFFITHSNGLKTQRDTWCYNFSKTALAKNIQTTIDFYNNNSPENVDATKFSWTRNSIDNKARGVEYKFGAGKILEAVYRPFCKENLYYYKYLNDRLYRMSKLFPAGDEENLLICITGAGGRKDFSVFISDKITDLEIVEKAQCFPLYWYESTAEGSLFGENYARREGVSDFILKNSRRLYGGGVTKADIFYYVYGFLHLAGYRAKFSAELKKSLPRIFLVNEPEKFWQLSKAGRALAEIHLNYENQPPAQVEIIQTAENYRVTKLKLSADKKTLIYNENITLKNIPAKSFEYVVNGRSPLEWIIDRYQIKTDKASQITNNPNDWAIEHEKPRYILDLILSCITVSLKTLEIVENLPEINFE